MTPSFTWSDFYLICFAVGFCFSFLSFVFGSFRIGHHMHPPHLHGHLAGHVPGPGGAASPHSPAGSGMRAQGSQISPFNFASLMAFMAWFGGAGFLLTRYSTLWVGFGLLMSIAIGLIGGTIVFLFLSKVLMSHSEYMDPADYEMVGVLGSICSSIREGGTGELLYSQMGTRRVCGARSDDGKAIAKGTEVVVTQYEKGIAYVRLWEQLSNE
jgi:membrane protein implicated in regulation of membrane protease activity